MGLVGMRKADVDLEMGLSPPHDRQALEVDGCFCGDRRFVPLSRRCTASENERYGSSSCCGNTCIAQVQIGT